MGLKGDMKFIEGLVFSACYFGGIVYVNPGFYASVYGTTEIH